MRDRRELTRNGPVPSSGQSDGEIAREGFERLDKATPDRVERDGLSEPVYKNRWDW